MVCKSEVLFGLFLEFIDNGACARKASSEQSRIFSRIFSIMFERYPTEVRASHTAP